MVRTLLDAASKVGHMSEWRHDLIWPALLCITLTPTLSQRERERITGETPALVYGALLAGALEGGRPPETVAKFLFCLARE